MCTPLQTRQATALLHARPGCQVQRTIRVLSQGRWAAEWGLGPYQFPCEQGKQQHSCTPVLAARCNVLHAFILHSRTPLKLGSCAHTTHTYTHTDCGLWQVTSNIRKTTVLDVMRRLLQPKNIMVRV
eukprot:1138986-Pelagomonas_calceolata.AAC.3